MQISILKSKISGYHTIKKLNTELEKLTLILEKLNNGQILGKKSEFGEETINQGKIK